MDDRLVLTGCGVISPIGIGLPHFANGLRAGVPAVAPLDDDRAAHLPFDRACTVRDFDVVALLGRKRTRTLDRTTAFAVATAGMALQDAGITVTPESESRIGVVLGTSNGSLKSACDFIRESYVQPRAYDVSPELFPNTVMNHAAAQCAIWHRLRAVNTTVAGARMAGVAALRYARRVLRSGYADLLVTGAVEEFCDEIAWGAHHASGGVVGRTVPVGEGAAMFCVERATTAAAAGRRPRAALAAIEATFTPPPADDGASPRPQELAAIIRRALDAAACDPRRVAVVATRECGDECLDAIEACALRMVFGNDGPARLAVGRLVGDCFSATGALQVAALLAHFADAGPGSVGLMTSLTRSGANGCVLLEAC